MAANRAVLSAFSVLVLLRLAVGRMNEFSIDINDILNDKLMPASLFLIEGPQGRHDNVSALDDITGLIAPGSVGNLQNAYATMGFHR